MALVRIPALLRELTGGASTLEAPGASVGEVIQSLEARCPGIAARLCENGRLRAELRVAVDGQVSQRGLRQAVREGSEVIFFPAISGGADTSFHAFLYAKSPRAKHD